MKSGAHAALCVLAVVLPSSALAHHGVASLGVAGLGGPGAPIETSSSATLPQGKFLAYLKLDYVDFETYTRARDDEKISNAFWMYGLGYGVRSWASVFLFVPYSAKKMENNAFNTVGFTDLSLMGVLGFKYDGGVRLVPASESLDDLEDLHATFYAGATLPTGHAEIRDADGAIDPGMSLGFGEPSWSLGLTATKTLSSRVTLCGETSHIGFLEHEYADGARVRFGPEARVNAALTARVFTSAASELRLDANLEGNYLRLGRDEADGAGEPATGGGMLYAVPGVRLFVGSSSLAVGLKRPVWTDLNEDADQQGAEGKERYRLIVTFSTVL